MLDIIISYDISVRLTLQSSAITCDHMKQI